MYETRRQKLARLKKLGIGNPKKNKEAKRTHPIRKKPLFQIKNPFYKPKKVQFEKIPEQEITEKQAKEVVERMKMGMKGLNPFMPKQSFKDKIIKIFKKK